MVLEILPPLASLVSGLFLVYNHRWLNSHFMGERERGVEEPATLLGSCVVPFEWLQKSNHYTI